MNANTNPATDWEITPAELKARLDAGEDVFFLDCRTIDEHAAASVDAATLLPMPDVPARLFELEEYLDRPVAVMCHHGMRSMQGVAFLKEQGFADVKSVAGGIDRWAREVDPTVPRY